MRNLKNFNNHNNCSNNLLAEGRKKDLVKERRSVWEGETVSLAWEWPFPTGVEMFLHSSAVFEKISVHSHLSSSVSTPVILTKPQYLPERYHSFLVLWAGYDGSTVTPLINTHTHMLTHTHWYKRHFGLSQLHKMLIETSWHINKKCYKFKEQHFK